MCGIFGIVSYGTTTYSKALIYQKAVKDLFKESEFRGREASGLCAVIHERPIVLKDKVPASKLVEQDAYKNIVGRICAGTSFRAVIGHTRMPTKGSKEYNINNHPIVAGNTIGVHNGVIYNDDVLFEEYKDKITRHGQVDSEIIFRLIDHFINTGKTIVDAVNETSKLARGSASCAFINTRNLKYLTLFSMSQIPVWIFKHVSIMVFASTTDILSRALTQTAGVLNPCYKTGEFEVCDEVARIDMGTGKVFKQKIRSEPSLGFDDNNGRKDTCQSCALYNTCKSRNLENCMYHNEPSKSRFIPFF